MKVYLCIVSHSGDEAIMDVKGTFDLAYQWLEERRMEWADLLTEPIDSEWNNATIHDIINDESHAYAEFDITVDDEKMTEVKTMVLGWDVDFGGASWEPVKWAKTGPYVRQEFRPIIELHTSSHRLNYKKYVVYHLGDVLGNGGEFEREPMPSERTEEFINRTRFDSLLDAIVAERSATYNDREHG